MSLFLKYQQKWLKDKSEVKVYEKSRRIGISWTEAAGDTLEAAKDTGGQDVWYIGYNKDMAEEFIKDCAFWAKIYNKAAGDIEEINIIDEDKEILAFRIRFASGKRITALSSRPSNLRGKQGIVVIDEAAFHDNLDELLKSALALLIWGGKVRIISTHDGVDNKFNELVEDIRAGKKKYSLHRTTIDDALEDGLYRAICKKLNKKYSKEEEKKWRESLFDFYGDGADEELLCIPKQSGGSYLSRALIESRMDKDIPVLRYECDDEFVLKPEEFRIRKTLRWCDENILPVIRELPPLPTYFGEDFGRSGDLTVIWLLQKLQDLSLRTPFIVELRNVPFEQQKQILFYIVDRLKIFCGGALDGRGNGEYLAEVALQKYGSTRIEKIMLSQTWYRENMPKYKAVFEDKEIILPKDLDILEDHRMIQVVKGIPVIPDNIRRKDAKGKQRHGDSAIAGALAVYAAKNDNFDSFDIITGYRREAVIATEKYKEKINWREY
jgi:phage FluMu gp28-like protein